MALTKVDKSVSSTPGIVDNSDATAITIDSSEQVGIGTTSMTQKLAVNGNIQLLGTGTDNDSYSLLFNNGACAIARDNNDLDLHAYNAMIFGVSNTSYPSSTERMRIDSSGNITTGNHPIFMAIEPAQTAGDANNVIVFGSENHDQGGHYNTSNGRFTAPVAGKYFFTVSILFQPNASGTSHYARLTFRKNGSGSTKYAESLNTAFTAGNTTTSNYQSLSMSTIISLAASDFVDVTNSGTMSTYGTNYGSFAGFLVG